MAGNDAEQRPAPVGERAANVVSDAGLFVQVAAVLALFVAIPVLLLLLLRQVILGGVRDGIKSAHRDDDPLTILQRRFARGEIDQAEYDERRRILTSR
jgi:uncharacterized membrane protein